jgi:3-hydroxyacyl-CoA dehydrogenase/enoyl-CoA hydratase/3-hydroxybutyryl-CoA epimerase
MSAEQREACWRASRPRSDADLAGCDLIIEAVFEDRELKAKVSLAAQKVVGPTR